MKLNRPKRDYNHTGLDDYREAEKLGEEKGECWSHYPECPLSIFNIIPDVYTKDDTIKVSFDGFEGGSGTVPDKNKNIKAEELYSNEINDDIMRMVKEQGLKIKQHNIDLDLTT